MNAKQAIDKIAELLKLTFKSEKFYSTRLDDGTEVTNNLDEDFKIGQVLYVVGESTLTPAPAGTHITRENLKLTIDGESVIIAIESGDVIAEDEAEMAETKEEQVLESNSFEVETGIVEEPEVEEEKEEGANLDDLLKLLVPMVEEMKKLKTEMDSMKEMMSAEMSALKTDFDGFKKSPEKFSVVEKKTYKESFEDYKLEIIKSLRK